MHEGLGSALLGSAPQYFYQTGVAVQACSPVSQEVERGGKVKVILSYIVSLTTRGSVGPWLDKRNLQSSFYHIDSVSPYALQQ